MTLPRQRWATVFSAPPAPPPGKGPEWGKAAPIGLLIILLLCAAFWMLMRSMNKHIRKVRALADAEAARADAEAARADAGTAEADAGTAEADAGTAQADPLRTDSPAVTNDLGTQLADSHRADPHRADPPERTQRTDS